MGTIVLNKPSRATNLHLLIHFTNALKRAQGY